MSLNLVEVDRVKTISKEDFIKNYFKPQKPVVIVNIIILFKYVFIIYIVLKIRFQIDIINVNSS